MSFSSFFSKQARRPSGLFGKYIMSLIFDKGNEPMNQFVYGLNVSSKKMMKSLRLVFGTGKLIKRIAKKIDKGIIEGADFSRTMVSIAGKRNRKNIENGKARLYEANFDEMPFENKLYNKIYSVNTIYFLAKSATYCQKNHGNSQTKRHVGISFCGCRGS